MLLEQFGPQEYEHESRAGCTATVVLVTPDEIYCANAGDSRTVLYKAGNAIDLSHDHKPSDEAEV